VFEYSISTADFIMKKYVSVAGFPIAVVPLLIPFNESTLRTQKPVLTRRAFSPGYKLDK
jgi:hypothetical protein